MQDTFTDGFYLFNRWKVASNVQSAVAINGTTAKSKYMYRATVME
jgi:hypothetical protein